MARVVRPALDHAGVEPGEVDGIFTGVMNNGFESRISRRHDLRFPSLPSRISPPLLERMRNRLCRHLRRSEFYRVGQGKIALVVGAEKMTAKPTAETGDTLLFAATGRRRQRSRRLSGIFARIAQNYFQRYGDRSEELARIAAKNHKNGAVNPLAQMRKSGFRSATPFRKEPLRRAPLAA